MKTLVCYGHVFPYGPVYCIGRINLVCVQCARKFVVYSLLNGAN